MIYKMYAIRDTGAEVFDRPIFARAHGEAERQFQNVVRDDQTVIGQHPEQFSLWYIGEFDDKTGEFTPLEGGSIVLCKAIDFPKE